PAFARFAEPQQHMASRTKIPTPEKSDPRTAAGLHLSDFTGRLLPEAFTNAAATFVDSLKINMVSEKIRRGRRIIVKRPTPMANNWRSWPTFIFAWQKYQSVSGPERRTGAGGKWRA